MKKKEGVFTFVVNHVKGHVLLEGGHENDDLGKPILKYRLYSFHKNRAFTKIKLNPRKKLTNQP